MIHNIQVQKKALRAALREKKRLFPNDKRAALAKQLFLHIEASTAFQSVHCIACYYALPDEVPTAEYIERWRCEGKTILLPVMNGNTMYFVEYKGKESLHIGAYGIEEPRGEAIDMDRYPVDLLLVPGVAFDSKGNRMGRGKGYYDRFLAQKQIHKIGICFHFQLVESIPCEATDIPMDAICTEMGFAKK